jgi:hypothetical protein
VASRLTTCFVSSSASAFMVDGPFYSFNCFNAIKRPQAVPNGSMSVGSGALTLPALIHR